MENENKVEEKKTEGGETAAKTSAPSAVWKKKGTECKEKMCAFWGENKKTIIAVLVLLVLIAGSFAFKKYYKPADIGQAAIRAKIQKFVDANVPEGTKTDIKEITKEGDLYKVTITVDKQDVTLYITRDGKSLIQQLIDVDKASQKQADNSQAAEKSAPEQKQAVPEVKLFVMSYCPYGTQMEKGILPVLNTLGNKIKFTLEFVDYSMHNSKSKTDPKLDDRKELDENLRQYCIQKNQPAKLNAYLNCFLQKGQGTEASCMASSGVNATQVASCMKEADTQFNVTKDFNDTSSYSGGQFPIFEVNKEDNVKYGVQGSPTLVINGTVVSANRDPQSLLTTICSGFTNAPKECTQKLSATAPAPGFGSGTASGSSAGAACATPAQ